MKKTTFGLIGIVVLALALRFYRLGQVPPSLDWDEVSLGYNAWALLETGRDEFGNTWPVSIRSFGDYKPPVYTYLLIPALKLFGRTELAVRLPSALLGTLTVLVTYFLVKELFFSGDSTSEESPPKAGAFRRAGKPTSQEEFADPGSFLGALSALLLAISPWHLQFSRIGFEANAGLFFFVVGVWLLLRWLSRASGKSLLLSAFSFSAALMTYHSLRVVVPLLVLAILLIYRREAWGLWRRQKWAVGVSVLVAVVALGLIGRTLIQGVGGSRLAETSFLTIDDLLTVSRRRIEESDGAWLDRMVNHRFLVYGEQYLRGYFDHFDLRFWFLDGDRIDRHRTPGVGLMYWWELLFLAAGMVRVAGWTRDGKSARVLAAWFLLAPAAAALTGGTPSAVRSLVFLPTFQILVAIGIVGVIRGIREIRGIWVVILMVGLSEFGHYLHQYYIQGPVEQAAAWQYGYKELVGRLMVEKDKYDRVVVTVTYDQPYIYFLWYGNYYPGRWINDGEFNKGFDGFEFRDIEWRDLQGASNLLVVGDPTEIPEGEWKWTVDYPSGKPVFAAAELK